MQNIHHVFPERSVVIHVGGKVQGVGFRYSTCVKAQKLGIVGYVKNLINGEVEIIACGTNEKINQLIQWLETEGPTFAKVKYCDINEIETDQHYVSFDVTY